MYHSDRVASCGVCAVSSRDAGFATRPQDKSSRSASPASTDIPSTSRSGAFSHLALSRVRGRDVASVWRYLQVDVCVNEGVLGGHAAIPRVARVAPPPPAIRKAILLIWMVWSVSILCVICRTYCLVGAPVMRSTHTHAPCLLHARPRDTFSALPCVESTHIESKQRRKRPTTRFTNKAKSSSSTTQPTFPKGSRPPVVCVLLSCPRVHTSQSTFPQHRPLRLVFAERPQRSAEGFLSHHRTSAVDVPPEAALNSHTAGHR